MSSGIYKQAFEELKQIEREFASTDTRMSLDEIESKYVRAKKAYDICSERVESLLSTIQKSE